MATDTRLDGTANWNTPGDWSTGVRDAKSDVAINAGGYPQVTASLGTVNSITDSGGLDFIVLIGPDGVECRVDKNGHWS